MPRKAPNGKRRPTHVGTRSILDNVEGSSAVIAFPMYRGEYLERIAIDGLNVTKSEETNVDQPPIFATYGFIIPMALYGFSLSTVLLDSMFQSAVTSAAGEYLGGEANPSGNFVQNLVQVGRVERIFARQVIGDPMPVGQDVLNNADARFTDRFRTVVKRGYEIETESICILGMHSWRLDAQTDFGVAEVDLSLTNDSWAGAYWDPVDDDGPVQQDKARELFYGGDNYIEADSFKETSRRCYMIARPVIHRMKRVGPFQ